MEWIFFVIAYLPFLSLLIGLALLITGFVLRKTKIKLSKGMFIAGGLFVGICMLVCIALFLVGALGIGPVPN